MGHTDLGDFHYERGDFNAALKCYVRTRDYCTTSKHIINMCLYVIRASIQMGAPPTPTRTPTSTLMATSTLPLTRFRPWVMGAREARCVAHCIAHCIAALCG